ncbi:MAG: nucleotide exchange factor GrpE [Acidocella sp. 20-57-95]|nr:MAG: nucleotide exchange factor GrpE [Acidocella sp. 20-57-95]OYV55924.1 MAG: nucleotide exchange factor GrpE [Acidocella sp. 21-58-7]
MAEPEVIGKLRVGFDDVGRSFANLLGQFALALQDMKDKLQQAEADMAELRARTRRDIEDARLFAIHKFGRDVVEAAENLKRGIDSLPKPEPGEPEIVTKMRDGFGGIERAFAALLERNGIDRQDPTGAIFNPDYHQAMAEQENPNLPAGTILHAWSQTWTLNGRLLRPGMVVVAKGGPPPDLRVG